MNRTIARLALTVLAVACGNNRDVAAHADSSGGSSSLELFAGNFGAPGSLDGSGAEASFDHPAGVAVDAVGNVYVADTDNNTIRKITPAGVVTTLAGMPQTPGSSDGTGAAARFNAPRGIAVDRAGNVYVADTDNHTIRKITSAGTVTTLAGVAKEEGNDDGDGAVARFDSPQGVAVDSSGNIYVANAGSQNIRMITPAGGVTTIAGWRTPAAIVNAGGSAARFVNPVGIAVDITGNIYVADDQSANDENDSSFFLIRKITPDRAVTTFAGAVVVKPGAPLTVDGNGASARFWDPTGVAADRAGNVYVASLDGTIRKITPAGDVSTFAGQSSPVDDGGTADGTGAAARFHRPTGVATDTAGNVYVADMENSTIRKITPAGVVTTLAGAPPVTGPADGSGAAAGFDHPDGIATDSAGNVYVADAGNHAIRKISPAGVVSTLARLVKNDSASRAVGGADSYRPIGVAVDRAGNTYVTADYDILKITPAGVVSIFVAARREHWPEGIAIDGAGDIFVADANNQTVRRFLPNGTELPFIGVPAVRGFGNGVGPQVLLSYPKAVAVDRVGNVYFTDGEGTGSGMDATVIRKSTHLGEVTTLAGARREHGSTDGTGAAAHFFMSVAIALAVDSAGNVYVPDTGNHTVRKITPAGVVTTIVGVAGKRGFAAGPLPGLLDSPRGVAISGTSLYITLRNGVAVVRNVP